MELEPITFKRSSDSPLEHGYYATFEDGGTEFQDLECERVKVVEWASDWLDSFDGLAPCWNQSQGAAAP